MIGAALLVAAQAECALELLEAGMPVGQCIVNFSVEGRMSTLR